MDNNANKPSPWLILDLCYVARSALKDLDDESNTIITCLYKLEDKLTNCNALCMRIHETAPMQKDEIMYELAEVTAEKNESGPLAIKKLKEMYAENKATLAEISYILKSITTELAALEIRRKKLEDDHNTQLQFAQGILCSSPGCGHAQSVILSYSFFQPKLPILRNRFGRFSGELEATGQSKIICQAMMDSIADLIDSVIAVIEKHMGDA